MSFTTTFTVDRPPAEVFAAVTNVRGWWSEEIEGGTSAVGDEFEWIGTTLHPPRPGAGVRVPRRLIATGKGRPNVDGTHQVPEVVR